MNKIKNNNSGITLVALIVTIIVMIIIISIATYEGKDIIAKSKLQTLETNMLTIQAKTRAYSEEIEAKVWALGNNKETQRTTEFNDKGLERQNDSSLEYTLTPEGLDAMGLSDIRTDPYTVIFSNDYQAIDVKYTPGVTYKGDVYYTLSSLQNLLENVEE